MGYVIFMAEYTYYTLPVVKYLSTPTRILGRGSWRIWIEWIFTFPPSSEGTSHARGTLYGRKRAEDYVSNSMIHMLI
jgi:hypothetical protein